MKESSFHKENKKRIAEGFAIYSELSPFNLDENKRFSSYSIAKSNSPLIATITSNGNFEFNCNVRSEPHEIAYVAAFLKMYLYLGYMDLNQLSNINYITATSLLTHSFIQETLPARIKPPGLVPLLPPSFSKNLNSLIQDVILRQDIYSDPGYYLSKEPGCIPFLEESTLSWRKPNNPLTHWPEQFSEILRTSIYNRLSKNSAHKDTPYSKAKEWFTFHFPLLGGITTNFKIVDDLKTVRALDIDIAAVSAEQKIIYVNPVKGYSEEQWKFIIAHEILHIALFHANRRKNRDPFLWNVACDYVINKWLMEMKLGQPVTGLLLDIDSTSAEEVYDHIVSSINKRKQSKFSTFASQGKEDMLDSSSWWKTVDGISLDEFIKSSLNRGLSYSVTLKNRGYLPASLLEEIKSLLQPPIPWDVKLADWFDINIDEPIKTRTYARASRRQSSTPNIPRPSYYYPEEVLKNHTFGIIIDTSLSMSEKDLAKALGSIVSYSTAKKVSTVRLVFCDAQPYDKGFVPVSDLQDVVEVQGRGGTVLQPAVNLLLNDKTFPQEAPILIITDGYCERHLSIPRNHAILLAPEGKPSFRVTGDLFVMDS